MKKTYILCVFMSLICLGCATTPTSKPVASEPPNASNIIMHIAYTNGDQESVPLNPTLIRNANVASVDHLPVINEKINSTNAILRISITQTYKAR